MEITVPTGAYLIALIITVGAALLIMVALNQPFGFKRALASLVERDFSA